MEALHHLRTNYHDRFDQLLSDYFAWKSAEPEVANLISNALGKGLTDNDISYWFEGKEQQLCVFLPRNLYYSFRDRESDHWAILDSFKTLRTKYPEHFDNVLSDYLSSLQSQQQSLPTNEQNPLQE